MMARHMLELYHNGLRTFVCKMFNYPLKGIKICKRNGSCNKLTPSMQMSHSHIINLKSRPGAKFSCTCCVFSFVILMLFLLH